MQQPVPISFFVCSPENARVEVLRQRPCDVWIYDWPALDPYWVFGDTFPPTDPLFDFSPLARAAYNYLDGQIQDAIGQAIQACEARRHGNTDKTIAGLRLHVNSQLAGGGSSDSASTTAVALARRVSIPFSPQEPPAACAPVRRELFALPVDFGYTMHGPEGDNIRWELRGAPPVSGSEGDSNAVPYFALYDRRLRFFGESGAQFLGTLHLLIDAVADLWVRFASRPIPAALAERVDPVQPLSYRLTEGGGRIDIAAPLEITHLESGQMYRQSLHGATWPPAHLPSDGVWPDAWQRMSMDETGIIRHGQYDRPFALTLPAPGTIGLPANGTYRVRVILLAMAYSTGPRAVWSEALGVPGDTRMSWKSLSLTHQPELITYTPGQTAGLIPPFEVVRYIPPVLETGIRCSIVGEFVHFTTYRFAVRVANALDFPVGIIVTVANEYASTTAWQAWLPLAPGEERTLGAALPVPGMSAGQLHRFHPASPYGWTSGTRRLECKLYVTAPSAPETQPAALPAGRATRQVAAGEPTPEQQAQGFASIKRYDFTGAYDLESQLHPPGRIDSALKTLDCTLNRPPTPSLLDPSTYFVGGFNSLTDPTHRRWFLSPWPWAVGDLNPPNGVIVFSGEVRQGFSEPPIWAWQEQIALTLSRAMLQAIAARLDLVTTVAMEGADLHWFSYRASGDAWCHALWVDRFYTDAGVLVDDAAMRAAFQAVMISQVPADRYRNVSVHPAVRFGAFCANGSFPVNAGIGGGGYAAGRYLPGQDGTLVDLPGLEALSTLGSRCLFRIADAFQ